MLKEQRENDSFPSRGGTTNTPSMTSLRQWTGLKDPRIVRVSRAFRGKDRHSKVRTVRGLRDRRVRLSVPTAIQLYDLQERLGLNQPSKVVDWLINAAQHEINKLPPLQYPPEIDPSSTQDLINHASLSLFNNKANFGENLVDSSQSYSALTSNLVLSSSQMETQIHNLNPSLLSLAPRTQLVFYPQISQSYGGINSTGFDAKELGNFSIESFGDSQNLTLSSLKNFHQSDRQ
ncbi:hypothetical protein LUZ60_001560 [Juncus effusus]|nr:hypothetical protein LUZ60_001560 [Juncus effusus]